MVKIDSLYLHFPYCLRLCNYCDFYKSPFDQHTSLSEFHQYLSNSRTIHQELEEEYKLFWAPMETLYIGGGSPSLWKEEGAHYLPQFLKTWNISLTPHCEFTIEANPGDWQKEDLARWKSLGVNRLSVGVQALENSILLALQRNHTAQQALNFLEIVRDSQIDFSVDLMLGLPLSEKVGRRAINELEQLLKFRPTHLSVYILKAPDHYKLKKDLPDDDWASKEYLDCCQLLEERGYHHYEVSNFALPGKESKHNLRYWKSQVVAALGPSAVGFFPTNDNEGIR
ncbi:MAG: radical SAM protein, partial [Pseudomonadota bacterium]